MKFKRLNESLVKESFIINIPIRVKLNIESNRLIQDLHEEIYKVVFDSIEEKENKYIFNYLQGMVDKIIEELNTPTFDMQDVYLNLDEFDNIPIMNGNLFFEVYIGKSINKSNITRVFNTLLNNNIINKEFTISIQEENIKVEVTKISNIEIGEN